MVRENNKERRMGFKRFFIFLLLMILLLGEAGKFQCHAANKYGTFVGKKPATYTQAGDTVYFYPKKIYYSGRKVICYVYVVNNTGAKITALSGTKLTIKNANDKVIAKYKFKGKKKVKIENGSYKTVKYVFPASSVIRKKFSFGNAKRMAIDASFTFYPE